ncbi:radical SAM protein [Adlercreutzia sp. ZJ154]|uniref:radical SAM protein n=1 Tax=Adlercreutzia sp. ZJ154 TaxID=2709790 RepID=UPI0013EA3D76|nr:radical SAM protein [Adlercreutzia sp. ZJ154]
MTAKNIEFQAAQEEYSAVERRYLEALQAKGLVFESAEAGRANQRECAELREQLAKRGVRVRNGGASLVWGYLSPACVECTGAKGSETFSTTFKCHRDCYFCFNHNVADYDKFVREGCPWEDGLAAASKRDLACIGLTGGEPLLNLDDSVRFLQRARELFPKAHLRMYTSGDLLTEDAARRLRDVGLDEIRFSVKDDDTPEMQQRVLDAMRLAKRYIPSVMAEMPIIPGADEHMHNLLRSFDEVGIDGINLLEFCFPFCNWHEFEKRGFKLKNPPFDVMYDYGYSGGLAVAGSEKLILQLMLWAIDEGLSLGLHYCSLDNKHRSEIRQKNERAADTHPCIVFDNEDFFLKAAKVFGQDIVPTKDALVAAGCSNFIEDADERSLAFNPKWSHVAQDAGAEVHTCYFVYENNEEGSYLVDVALA